MERGGVREEHLGGVRHELIPNWEVVDGVEDVFIENLEDTVSGDVEVQWPFGLTNGLRGCVTDPKGVVDCGVIDGHCMRFFNCERVLVSVDCRIDAKREEMLMIRSHDSWCNYLTIGYEISDVDGTC